MFDNLDDACEATVTRAQAEREITLHSDYHENLWAEFLAEEGDRETYKGQVIFDWLGY